MLQVKVFDGSPQTVGKNLNAWLASDEVKKYAVMDIQQAYAANDGGVDYVAMAVYNDSPEPVQPPVAFNPPVVQNPPNIGTPAPE